MVQSNLNGKKKSKPVFNKKVIYVDKFFVLNPKSGL